jgi:hypothetical protein
MKEQIANYNPNKRKPWLTRKLQGLLNKVSAKWRHIKWMLHLSRHPVRYDKTKVAASGVPIIVNNFNRLDVLQQEITWLNTLEYSAGILIVDNKSDYQPLLDFYESLKDQPLIQVVYLGHNSWRKGAAELARVLFALHPYVIITDPDLLPYPSTPTDLIRKLVAITEDHPRYNHVGLSLEINDLPDHNPLKTNIIQHESVHWDKPLKESRIPVFVAPIDTTFALYHRRSVVEAYGPALRTDRPYTVQHIDWYQDPTVRSSEYNHYLGSAKIFATWAMEVKARLGKK